MSQNIFSRKPKVLIRYVVPATLWESLSFVKRGVLGAKNSLHLAYLRNRMWKKPANTIVQYLGFQVQITDGPNFYIQYKDEFLQRIYHFEAVRPDPLIIDGGSNIGMSILYFKSIYPKARIIGFVPDPTIYSILQDNLTRNQIQGVTIHNTGLGPKTGSMIFSPDGHAGGYLAEGGQGISVQIEQLSNYLNEPVDFLKLNIEGQELPVLQEAAASQKLQNVRELVLEYHGWRGINVDAAPGSMRPFQAQRAEDINVEAAISNEEKTLKFHIFNKSALNSFDEVLSRQRENSEDYRIIEVKEITTQRLETVLKDYLPEKIQIDFLSVDVEGLDLEVLQSNNWQIFRPSYVLVEVHAILENIAKDPIYLFLIEQGYALVAKTLRTAIFEDRCLNA